ncbi:hypothetical protein A0256_23155 [Mucilaginibacter sp. PAMC 26640]|nr:hypothetical protein A0256_23155 [Mucilaginibacter sp. PAMC 26640]
MAKQTTIEDKELTPAQGAEGTVQQAQDPVVISENPEWVEQLIASNQAVVDSNADMKQCILDYKEEVLGFLKHISKTDTETARVFAEDEFDEYEDYEVAAGKSFRDPKDFSKEYTEGDDVMHLDAETLKRLHAQGYITEA